MTDQEIHDICNKYNITNYTINPDQSIDVNGSVNLSDKGLTKLPLRFNRVGDFHCGNNQLTSLEGSPTIVEQHFYCNDNQLTSLEHGPKEIGTKYNGLYVATDNYITNLDGFDTIGYAYIYIESNPIASVFIKNRKYGIHEFTTEYINWFKRLKIIKGDQVNLKRLKYLSTIIDIKIDLEEIKKHYTIS